MKPINCALSLALLTASPSLAQESDLPAGTYRLDPYHSTLVFSVSHLGFSSYVMSFDQFDALLEIDPSDPEKSSISATIDPSSLDLPSPPEGFLDELLGETWLNAASFPEITFVSNRIEPTGAQTADVHCELKLLGVVRPVVLNVKFNGGYPGHPMDPNARIGFSADAEFPRSEFGMDFAVPAPGSSMGVGDAVTVRIEAEFTGPPLEDSGTDE